MAESGGVEWVLELQAKLDQATKMVKALSQAELAALKTDAALKKAEKTTGLFNRAMGAAAGAIGNFARSSLGHLAALASFEGLKRIAGGIVHVGEEALQAAGEAERMRRSFEHMIGDQPADELLGFLDNLASYTEFTDGALKGFASQLVRTGFAGEGLKRALAATIDLAALAPEKMAGAAEALALISKVKLKGGVSERELVSAGLAPKGFFERVAKETGVGLAAVEKRISEGKVKTSVLLEALYSQVAAKTGKPLGGAGVNMSMLFLSQVEKAKDIIPNLFEELERTGGLRAVTAALAQLARTLDPSSATGQKIVGGLERMLNGFADLVNKIDFEKFALTVTRLFERLPGFIEASAAALLKFVEVAERLLPDRAVAPDSAAGIAAGNAAFDDKQAHPWLARATGWVNEKLFGAPQWAPDFQGAGVKSAEGFARGLTQGAPGVALAAEQTADASTEATEKKLGIKSPSRVFADLGAQAAAGFQLGIMGGIPGVMGAVASLGGGATGAVPGLGASSAPGGSFEAHITVNVVAPGGGDRETGETVALSVRKAMEEVFGLYRLEGAGS